MDAVSSPEFLTTREVAALLRVKERKVYELASAGAIPCRRVTGKLLFPRAELEAWLARDSGAPAMAAVSPPAAAGAARPNVLAGSHDPLLEWALREAGSGMAVYFDGSLDGLDRLDRGDAVAAGLHVFEPEDGGWNVNHVCTRFADTPLVLIEWARRQQGLIVAPDQAGKVQTVADLKGRRVALRQRTAGARLLFEHLLSQAGLTDDDLRPGPAAARTELDAAAAVADGEAEASLGLACMARQFGLPFVPLVEERFDLLVDRHGYFEPAMQGLLAFCHEPAFAAKAAAMGGYDLRGHGRVHWNGR